MRAKEIELQELELKYVNLPKNVLEEVREIVACWVMLAIPLKLFKSHNTSVVFVLHEQMTSKKMINRNASDKKNQKCVDEIIQPHKEQHQFMNT